MRLLVARCSVTYEGKLGARLGPAIRLILCKADGSIAIDSDAKAYKPLNWMNPPCTISEVDGSIVARTPKGETLRIELQEIVSDTTIELGLDLGLEKDGVEAELQQLIAARVVALRDDLTLVRLEFSTDIGPIDLLCRDGDGRSGSLDEFTAIPVVLDHLRPVFLRLLRLDGAGHGVYAHDDFATSAHPDPRFAR